MKAGESFPSSYIHSNGLSVSPVVKDDGAEEDEVSEASDEEVNEKDMAEIVKILGE